MKGGERRSNFFPKEPLECGGCANLISLEIRPAEVPFLSTFLLPPLQMYTVPGAWRKNFAVLLKRKDGLSWRHWRWEAIPLDSDINAVHELKKKRYLKGYRHSVNPPQTSPTPPLPGKNVQHACWTLYSMPSLHTVWCGHQCSVLCFACCCATLHHLHTSNANATMR